MQYAKAMGMRVLAVDGGEEKGRLCAELGAERYLDYTQTEDLEAAVKEITVLGGTIRPSCWAWSEG